MQTGRKQRAKESKPARLCKVGKEVTRLEITKRESLCLAGTDVQRGGTGTTR